MVVLSNYSPRFTSFWQANHLSTFSIIGLILTSCVVCFDVYFSHVLPRALCRRRETGGAALGTPQASLPADHSRSPKNLAVIR